MEKIAPDSPALSTFVVQNAAIMSPPRLFVVCAIALQASVNARQA